jgi:tetratricopeptide (TPR) repeat protein
MKLGYDFTVYPMTDLIEQNPLPAWPDTLNRTERARRALPYAQLATELAPTSWLAFFELAYVHKLLGQTEQMRQAAQRAVNYSPVRGARFVREYLDLTITKTGKVM